LLVDLEADLRVNGIVGQRGHGPGESARG
jgi:hypothetical protein